ncbi:MAG: hypothetical protein LBU12_03410 [Deltaproteobacteria bacterium]|nr:hypothetical protein [Deltaproteobacteria bacterium]
MNYVDSQRKRAIQLVEGGFFEGDPGGAMFKGTPQRHVLQSGLFNLYPDIRTNAIEYFEKNDISWWFGSRPNGHTLATQTACLNHLFPLRQDKKAVLNLLKTFSNEFTDVFTIPEKLEGFIQFESLGANANHLKEGFSSRGVNCTCLGALIIAKRKSGRRVLIPIDWVYTESYRHDDKSLGNKGASRKARYLSLIENSNFLNEDALNYVWFEPFFRLMKQTVLAEQIIVHQDPGYEADDLLFLHVVPSENEQFLGAYRSSGKSMLETWKSCLVNPEKYVLIDPSKLWSRQEKRAVLAQYLKHRYW